MMFDPNQFLETTTTEANDTKVIPVPVGEYIATVKEVKARQWTSKDQTKTGVTLDVIWDIDSAPVRELLGRDTVTCQQGVMLDVTDSGSLDLGKGRNVGLGRLREALNLNTPGQPFSFQMLPSRVAKIRVEHDVVGEDIYARVKAVAKIG